MGKAQRTQQSARQKIAAQQAAARREQARNRVLMAGGGVLLVIAIVVAFVIVKALHHAPKPKATATVASAGIARQVTSVPQTVLDSIGAGPTGKAGVSPLTSISRAPALTAGGKPEVLYVGAEYCPYCAAERWAMVVALSRFGTFTGLHFIHSSSTDYYAGTPTLTFYQTGYTSKYLTFVPVETATVTSQPLQQPTSAQSALLNKYGQGSYPFVDIGNKWVISGAQFLPSVLGTVYGPGIPSSAALSWAQIAQDLKTPGSPVAQQVLAAANHVTAAICQVTDGQPGNVCTSAAVTAVGRSI